MNVVPIAGAAASAKIDEAKAARAAQVAVLRDFTDRFEAGSVREYLLIATTDSRMIETQTCASVFDSIALSSLLHRWAVSRMVA